MFTNFQSPNLQREIIRKNEKKDYKQCLLDTPRRVTVTNKRLTSKHIKSEKKLHIYKSHGNIKNYKGKLL